MRCGIVEMHYGSWITCTVPAVQNRRNEPEHLFMEVDAIELFPEWDRIMKMTPWILTNIITIVFGQLSYA
jgi:hypothetical protein